MNFLNPLQQLHTVAHLAALEISRAQGQAGYWVEHHTQMGFEIAQRQTLTNAG
jgi:hypothetical protein